MVKFLPDLGIFTVFLKNRNFISKISISKVTYYAALMESVRPFYVRVLSKSRKSKLTKVQSMTKILFLMFLFCLFGNYIYTWVIQ